MRSTIIFFAFFAGTAALTCFEQAYEPNPTALRLCPSNTTQCYKLSAKVDGQKGYGYGCAVPQMTQIGPGSVCSSIKNGDCSEQKYSTFTASICCCGTDQCNTSKYYQPLVAVMTIIVGRFL